MNRIISKSRLSDNVYKMQLEAPLVAQERKAGQFVILMVDDELGERIPLTRSARRASSSSLWSTTSLASASRSP